MGLFSKKYCDVCGEKIGLLGNRKLEDGNLCSDCAAKLSPWFTGRRLSTLADIKEQLDYREANKAAVAAFHTTATFGEDMKLLVDEQAGKFMATEEKHLKNIEKANPDVLSFSDVTGCDIDVEEDRHEIYYRDGEGDLQSFEPRCYAYNYDFYVVIHVRNPYFNEIRFKLNDYKVDGKAETIIELHSGRPIKPKSGPNAGGGKAGAFFAAGMTNGALPRMPVSNADVVKKCPEYKEYMNIGKQIKATLLQAK